MKRIGIEISACYDSLRFRYDFVVFVMIDFKAKKERKKKKKK